MITYGVEQLIRSRGPHLALAQMTIPLWWPSPGESKEEVNGVYYPKSETVSQFSLLTVLR